MDQPPLTLNPRLALDAAGQRIGALLFRALTRIDSELRAQPDLASNWEVGQGAKLWKFRFPGDQKDHAGNPISAESFLKCMEEYRAGKPASPLAANLSDWKATRLERRPEGTYVVFELGKADPYLAKNLSLLRYFTPEGQPPCSDPRGGAKVIGSGTYRPAAWNPAPESELKLLPVNSGLVPLELQFIRDETTRAMKLLRGEADALQNGLSLTKTRWVAEKHGDQFSVLEREGVNVSYLAFNLSDPTLAKLAVRQAIAAAIDRESIVQHKWLGFGSIAGSFLSPLLSESKQSPVAYDPARAEKLLESAGLKRGSDGLRLHLRYKTTPVREGLETGLMFQEMLRKIGVELRLEVVEPAVFLTSIRKGAFQLYASRWIGVSDGSILMSTLHSEQRNNRAKYRDSTMDQLLTKAMAEVDPLKRTELLGEVQEKMAKDLPYLPLWYWKNALVVRRGAFPHSVSANGLSLSGALEPLARLLSEGAR